MPFKEFSDEQFIQLKYEFDQLSTIEEKYNFWHKRLERSYLSVGFSLPLLEKGVKDFMIYPQHGEETEQFNMLLFKEARRIDSFGKGRGIMQDYESLVSTLNIKLEGVINQKSVLEGEINWINSEVHYFKVLPKTNVVDYVFGLSLSQYWLKAYEDYYLKRNKFNFRNELHNYASIMGSYGGCEMAKYQVYVEALIKNGGKKQTPLNQEETSLKQQLLLFYYTGYIKYLQSVKSEGEKNKFLATLLNRSVDNVKKILTHIHHPARSYKIKTKENLLFVLEKLDKAGLRNEAEEVKKELKTLNSEK